jgi:hypothetical protein
MFNVSTPLANQTLALKVVFFDFDKTLVVNSMGGEILTRCDPGCLLYLDNTTCACNATDHQFGDYYVANWAAEALAEGPATPNMNSSGWGINGTDRRDRLIATFNVLRQYGVDFKVLSTSWSRINSTQWAYFLAKVFENSGLSTYLNLTNIIALADPGNGISGDKGGAAQQVLNSKSWALNQGLLADDSAGNIVTAQGKVGWLQVFPKTGLAVDALVWIETRAAQFQTTPAAPTPKNSGFGLAPCLYSFFALVVVFFQ